MNRRDLLHLAILSPLGGALAASSAWARGAVPPIAPGRVDLTRLRPEILEIVGDRRRREGIARAYRRARPNESLPEIERKVRAAVASQVAPDRVRASSMRRLVRREYAEGRTMELDGWILSETEARQCVLYVTDHASSI